MPDRVGYDEWMRMLRAAIEAIRNNHEHLSKLDSFGGDGDHGTTMVRAMARVESAAQATSPRVESLLRDVGWAVMGVDGGATGPLFGSLFMAMGEAAAGNESLDAAGLATVFEAGRAGVQKRTKAQVGDKTMIDALVPAADALREAVDSGASISGAMTRAAEGAEQGASDTKEMQARFGRAKNIGEQSIGEQDPGATSVALILRAFSEALAP